MKKKWKPFPLCGAQGRRLSAVLTWLVICTQLIALVSTVTVGAVQPTPEMAQAAAQQVGLGDWLAQRAAALAGWGQRLWGAPQTAHAETGSFVLTTGGQQFTCALDNNGGVKCWGNNAFGQLGNGTTTNSSLPVQVSGLTSGVIDIAAGGHFACALLNTGGVKCWGYNAFGQLGNKDFINQANQNTPVDVYELQSGVVALDGGL